MRIVCLANSYKEKGRCLAGIQLDNNNDPILKSGAAIWIRPISNLDHGQIPDVICSNISLLDIIEFDNANLVGKGYQSENTSFDLESLRKVGKFDINNLENLCNNDDLGFLFGNKGKAIHEESINDVSSSLLMINSDAFEITEKLYDGKKYPKVRLTFDYGVFSYDLPITDPTFLDNYSKNKNLLDNQDHIYLTISLAVPQGEWYSKLIAGIIY